MRSVLCSLVPVVAFNLKIEHSFISFSLSFSPFGSVQLRRHGLGARRLRADVGPVLLQDGSEGHEVQRVSGRKHDGHERLRQR